MSQSKTFEEFWNNPETIALRKKMNNKEDKKVSDSIDKLHNIALEMYNSKTTRGFYEDFTKDELVTLWTHYCIYWTDTKGNTIAPLAPYDDEVYDALARYGYWEDLKSQNIDCDLSLTQYTEYIKDKLDDAGYYTEITDNGGVLFSLTNKVRGLEGMYAEITKDELMFHLEEMDEEEKGDILKGIK
jgi:hypothetical protein